MFSSIDFDLKTVDNVSHYLLKIRPDGGREEKCCLLNKDLFLPPKQVHFILLMKYANQGSKKK